MKTSTIITALLITVLPVTACGSHKATLKENASIVSYSQDDNSEGPNIIRDLKLTNFSAIQNRYSAQIQYTQGSHYKVTFEGSQKAYDIFKFTVEDGTLKIDVKDQYKNKSINLENDIILHVTSPSLGSLVNSGVLTFNASNWKADNLNIKNSGSCKFHAQITKGQDINLKNSGVITVNATINNSRSVNIDNSGSFKFTEGSIMAEDVSIRNSGVSSVDVPLQVKNTFQLSNSGSSKLNGTVKATSYKETCSGATHNNVSIEANDLALAISGAGHIEGSFKGKNAEIKGSGVSKIDMTVDCEKLYIDSNGSSKVTVKGTADHTEFENNGVTKVDASELNKF